jgi:hypothetical protein
MNVCIYGPGEQATGAGYEIKEALRVSGEHYVVESPTQADVTVCVIADTFEAVESFIFDAGPCQVVLYFAGKASECNCFGAARTLEELMAILECAKSVADLATCFAHPVCM